MNCQLDHATLKAEGDQECPECGADLSASSCSALRNFLTPEECAQQFELYALSHPSKDSQHSLKFCADFLREFCVQISKPNVKLRGCAAVRAIPLERVVKW
jgi:hypothetical protein